MTETNSQIDDLIVQAERLEPGPVRVSALQEAVRLADSFNDLRRGFTARMSLCQAATFSGFHDIALIVFSWCLAQADKNVSLFGFSVWDLLWRYKWILGNLTEFPQISKEQILQALDDFSDRLRKAGHSKRTEFDYRWHVAMGLGDLVSAEENYTRWQQYPRDNLSNCQACELKSQVGFVLWKAEEAKALALAQPIITGTLSCMGSPGTRMPATLCALVRAGRRVEAARNQATDYRAISGDRGHLASIECHINYFLLIGEVTKALELFERHLPWALEARNRDDQFHFYRGGRALMRKLQDLSVPIHLPQTLLTSGMVVGDRASHVCGWLDSQCRDLAEQFDRRNGNDAYMRTLLETDPIEPRTGSAEPVIVIESNTQRQARVATASTFIAELPTFKSSKIPSAQTESSNQGLMPLRCKNEERRSKRNDKDLRDPCPNCGVLSYKGGYCFGCGIYRSSARTPEPAELDAFAFTQRNFGYRVSALCEFRN